MNLAGGCLLARWSGMKGGVRVAASAKSSFSR